MFKWLAQLNLWVDRLPYFHGCMLAILFGPWIILDATLVFMGKDISSVFPPIWIIFLTSMRMWWLKGNLKKYL